MPQSIDLPKGIDHISFTESLAQGIQLEHASRNAPFQTTQAFTEHAWHQAEVFLDRYYSALSIAEYTHARTSQKQHLLEALFNRHLEQNRTTFPYTTFYAVCIAVGLAFHQLQIPKDIQTLISQRSMSYCEKQSMLCYSKNGHPPIDLTRPKTLSIHLGDVTSAIFIDPAVTPAEKTRAFSTLWHMVSKRTLFAYRFNAPTGVAILKGYITLPKRDMAKVEQYFSNSTRVTAYDLSVALGTCLILKQDQLNGESITAAHNRELDRKYFTISQVRTVGRALDRMDVIREVQEDLRLSATPQNYRD